MGHVPLRETLRRLKANLLPSNIKQFENYYEQSEQKYELLQNSRTTSYELGLLDALQNSG